jgi:hypothetical protein
MLAMWVAMTPHGTLQGAANIWQQKLRENVCNTCAEIKKFSLTKKIRFKE